VLLLFGLIIIDLNDFSEFDEDYMKGAFFFLPFFPFLIFFESGFKSIFFSFIFCLIDFGYYGGILSSCFDFWSSELK
jgi:hypothetical protein